MTTNNTGGWEPPVVERTWQYLRKDGKTAYKIRYIGGKTVYRLSLTTKWKDLLKTCPDCQAAKAARVKPYARCLPHRTQYNLEWQARNPEKVLESVKKKQRKLKSIVFSHYSKGTPTCACCGETILQFLTIDHINNDGGAHRAKIGANNIYPWLKRNNYPEGFQVLCFNCNCGKSVNKGTCPHLSIIKGEDK